MVTTSIVQSNYILFVVYHLISSNGNLMYVCFDNCIVLFEKIKKKLLCWYQKNFFYFTLLRVLIKTDVWYHVYRVRAAHLYGELNLHLRHICFYTSADNTVSFVCSEKITIITFKIKLYNRNSVEQNHLITTIE